MSRAKGLALNRVPDAEAPRVASARVDLSGSPRQSLVLNLD